MVSNKRAIDSLTEIKNDFEEVWHKLFDLSQELTESEHRAQLLERLGNYITTLDHHELISTYLIGKIMDLLTNLLKDNRKNDLRLRLRAEIEDVNTNVSNSKVMLELIVQSLSKVHEELLNSQY